MSHGKIMVLLVLLVSVSACKADLSHARVDTSTAPASNNPEASAQSLREPTAPSSDTKMESVMPINANASLSDSGELQVAAGDVSIQLKGAACKESTPTVRLCNQGVALTVMKADGNMKQTLHPEAVYVDSEATLYRGPLDEAYKVNGHTFILTDVNGDGVEDLIVWTGKEGNYGGSSFDIFLFDGAKKEFVFNREFSDLTIGANGLFSIEQGSLKVTSGDGCCLHVYDTYAVKNGLPQLVERVTEDTTDGTGTPKVKTERLVDGSLMEVKTRN